MRDAPPGSCVANHGDRTLAKLRLKTSSSASRPHTGPVAPNPAAGARGGPYTPRRAR